MLHTGRNGCTLTSARMSVSKDGHVYTSKDGHLYAGRVILEKNGAFILREMGVSPLVRTSASHPVSDNF